METKKGPATLKAKPSQNNNTNYNANFKDLVDVVLDNNNVRFLTKKDGNLVIEKEHKDVQTVYVPPKINKLPIALSKAEDVIKAYRQWHFDAYGENHMLFLDIVKYLTEISDLPNKDYYPLLAAWVMHTYCQEDSNYSPILCFYAVAERGKTRTGKALSFLAYRGIRLTSLREASIFRSAENLHASLFFDISDMWETVRKNNCEDILLNRFEKGSTVPRVLYPDKGAFEDTHYYEVFGPTIIATNSPLNEILETRSIIISMLESNNIFSNELNAASTANLRARLLAFRAFYLNVKLPEPEKLFSGRIGDILRPLHKIIQFVNPDEVEAFIALANDIKNYSVTDKAMTREGEVLRTIIGMEDMVTGGILSISEIAQLHNLDKPERFHTSPKSIGRIVQSLGFYSGKHRPRTSDGNAAIFWDEKLITKLAKSYGLEYIPLDDDEPADVSGVSGVIDNLV